MSEQFRMIVAKGISNRWSVLSVGGESNDTEYCSAHDDIESLLNDCNLEGGIGQGDLPTDLGIYLFDCEFYHDTSLAPTYDPNNDLYINLKSWLPLLTMDIPLYKSGHMRVSLSPCETPILTAKQIIERAKNVPAEDVAGAILKHTCEIEDVAKAICKDLSVGKTYTIRDKYKASIWDREEFDNRTITITKFIDEEVPGCSCKEAKLLTFGSAQMFHPDFIVDCESCPFHLSWSERKEYYQNKLKDGKWLSEDEEEDPIDDPDDPVGLCMSCKFYKISINTEGCHNPEMDKTELFKIFPCPGYEEADNPGFVIKENYIYTVGYGNRTPEELIAVLKDNNIQLVFDVRRIGSKGRLRAYDYGANLKRFLNQYNIRYNERHCIGNYCDSLDEYKENIKTSVMEWIADKIIKVKLTTCFLCSELHAYKDNKVNCHRVHVADAVAKELRKQTKEPWGIKHL